MSCKTLTTVLYAVWIFLLSAAFSIPLVFCTSQEEAEFAIQSAEGTVLNSYTAVFEAEKAGANISHLLNLLNEAGWLLSRAKLAYNNGDFDSAFAYAENCSQKLEGFMEQANNLKLEAERAGYMDFLVNYVGSAVGSVAIVVGGYTVWALIKKREKL